MTAKPINFSLGRGLNRMAVATTALAATPQVILRLEEEEEKQLKEKTTFDLRSACIEWLRTEENKDEVEARVDELLEKSTPDEKQMLTEYLYGCKYGVQDLIERLAESLAEALKPTMTAFSDFVERLPKLHQFGTTSLSMIKEDKQSYNLMTCTRCGSTKIRWNPNLEKFRCRTCGTFHVSE